MVKFRPFFEVRKNFILLDYEHIVHNFEVRDPDISNMLVLSRNIQISRFYERFYDLCKIY